MKKLLIFFIAFFFGFLITTNTYAFIPDDPFYGEQWYLEKINAPKAWDITLGQHEVVVAVIDTGADLSHPDINYWRNRDENPNDGIDNDSNGYVDDYYGWNFVDNNNDVEPKANGLTDEELKIIHHGTIIAGLVGAIPNNNEGISGISWKTSIMPLRIATLDGYTDTSKVSGAVNYAIANGADVINLSFVSIDDFQDPNLSRALKLAYENDILVVAAAGNSDDEHPNGINLDEEAFYPVCERDSNGKKIVIGVAAVDEFDQKAGFSNYGSTCVEISAPGTGIKSTHFHEPTNPKLLEKYGGYWSGTSFAAPLVSAAAAYMKSINNNLTIEEQINYLISTGNNINTYNPQYIGRLGTRINLENLVNAVYNNETPTAVPETKPQTIPVDGPVLTLSTGESTKLKHFIAPYAKASPEITYLNSDYTKQNSFLGFNKWFDGGVRMILAPTNNFDLFEPIIAPGPGGTPFVRQFTQSGILLNEFLAYNANFKGGVNLGYGDVDGDENFEIITAPQSNGGPHIRVFDRNGIPKYQFFADSTSLRIGVNIAVGDVNNDGLDEIITSFENGKEPIVKVFNYKGDLLSSFLAYAESFKGGVKVATGDINGDGVDEIITGAGQSGGPHIRIFDTDGNVLNQFFAYGENFRGGTLVTTFDIDLDAVDDIVITPQTGSQKVRIFNRTGELKKEFSVYGDDYKDGIVIGFDYELEL